MSVPSVFGQGPVAFKQAPAGEFEDKPKLEFTVAEIVKGKAVYTPNPAYQGKTLVIDIKGPATFSSTNSDGVQVEKTAVDTNSIKVVETGEVFEGQRIFTTGIVRQIQGLAGQTIIASVGTYETEKRKGQKFVQLVEPTAEQVAAAQAVPAVLHEGEYVVGKSASDAPF